MEISTIYEYNFTLKKITNMTIISNYDNIVDKFENWAPKIVLNIIKLWH